MNRECALTLVLLAVLFMGAQPSAPAQEDDATDDAAVRNPAISYLEGWHYGNVAQTKSALHPQVVMQVACTDPNTIKTALRTLDASSLLQSRRTAVGSPHTEDWWWDVRTLDRVNDVAVIKIMSSDGVGYLEEAKAGTEWKIVNVLWEPTPDQTAANAVFPCGSAERIDHVDRPNRIDAADRVDK